MPSSFNPDVYKNNQRHDWNSVSSGWEKWWDTIEKGANIVSVRMLEKAGIRPGHHVLDVATGIGEPALNAAQRVGVSGHVTAIDQAGDMLAVAKHRAKTQGLNNIVFQEMDGEILGTSKDDFDAVLCRWGLMFMPNVDEALARMHQLLKPGGRIAAAVWSSPEKVPSISLAMGIVKELLELPPPPPEAPNPFCLSDTASLLRRFQKAGFKDVQTESIMVDFKMPSAEVYTEFTKDINAPLMALLVDRPYEQQELIWTSITKAVRAFAIADGSIQLQNEAICVSGTR